MDESPSRGRASSSRDPPRDESLCSVSAVRNWSHENVEIAPDDSKGRKISSRTLGILLPSVDEASKAQCGAAKVRDRLGNRLIVSARKTADSGTGLSKMRERKAKLAREVADAPERRRGARHFRSPGVSETADRERTLRESPESVRKSRLLVAFNICRAIYLSSGKSMRYSRCAIIPYE